MSGANTSGNGPDLAQGIVTADLTDGVMLRAMSTTRRHCWPGAAPDLLAIGATCTHYGGPRRLGSRCGRYDTLSLAPCLFQPAHRRRVAAARAQRPAVLAGRATRRRGGGWRSIAAAGAAVALRRRFAGVDRDRRRWRGGHAAAETLRRVRLCRSRDIAECRCRPAVRPAQPVQGLPRRAGRWTGFRCAHLISIRSMRSTCGLAPAPLRSNRARMRCCWRTAADCHYGALLLATGAEPVRLDVPGATLPHVHVLRTLADSEALIAARGRRRARCVVVGASFIGLEVAASLRTRGLVVHVVAPEARPWSASWVRRSATWCARSMNRTGSPSISARRPLRARGTRVTLSTGERLAADLVVVGVGVRPVIALAERAG